MGFSQLFCLKWSVEITTVKAIDLIYKYDQRSWPYPSPNTTFVVPPCSDTSIQNQDKSDYDASMGENDVACARLHRNTNHDGNTDGKNNDALQSYETPCRGIPFFLFWWYNYQHNHTTISQTASTRKRTSRFSNWMEKCPCSKMC